MEPTKQTIRRTQHEAGATNKNITPKGMVTKKNNNEPPKHKLTKNNKQEQETTTQHTTIRTTHIK